MATPHHNDEQGDVIWIRNGSHTIHICRKHEGIGIPVITSIISTCDMAKGTLARRGHLIFDQGNLLPHVIPQSRIISFLWTKSTHQNKKKKARPSKKKTDLGQCALYNHTWQRTTASNKTIPHSHTDS